MNLNELFERIKSEHQSTPPLSESRIAELEGRLEYALPGDLREFYRLCNGAGLFGNQNNRRFQNDWRIQILPLERVRPVTLDILGEDEDEWCPHTKSWYSICDVQDGNYIAADLSSVSGSRCRMIDCFHETYSSGDVIALSFTEFLQEALNTGPEYYWLQENFKSYGRLYKIKN